MSDLVGNPEYQCSHNKAHILWQKIKMYSPFSDNTAIFIHHLRLFQDLEIILENNDRGAMNSAFSCHSFKKFLTFVQFNLFNCMMLCDRPSSALYEDYAWHILTANSIC